ncbi:glycoside hydrolase family 25 protein [Telluribacter humicola]|uniref:glycoside hydrolase family 25 protein n=1 Tax=Telluribacter humicola TaxID=1720261 RepID=UPI001A96F4C4|nr:GH25 family lysozyme [Telluribacter humicola]
MARKAQQFKTNKEPDKKPLPLMGWGIIVGIGLLIGGIAWWMSHRNENQWRHVQRFGIRLPMRYPLHGIDVSHHNARIDWDKLKAVKSEGVKVDFVYIKATEGATHADRQYVRNWKEARRVGIRRGAYHFYNPRVYSSLQADNFIKRVRMEEGDLPPVLDLEIEAGKPADIIIKGVKNWLTIIENHYGVKPIIYTNEHFYQKYIAGNFDEYPLWLAGYSRTHLDDLAENAHVLFWQHSERGWVDGVKGYVDFNVYLHDVETWEEVGKN